MVTEMHNFHIPVMGLAFTVDSPLKVARYGISSVVAICDDTLIEQMRRHHLQTNGLPYQPILPKDEDYRAKRICSYLNLLHRLVGEQFRQLKETPFQKGSEITKYFELLPDISPLKQAYQLMLEEKDMQKKARLEKELRQKIKPGSIDVNIMTKLDKTNYSKSGEALPAEFSDALAALRGFALSDLDASIVFSAGLNPRLFNYIESFHDFFPDNNGHIKKRIIIKVSDYRSALIQGKYLAKKGLWVSEFRIESGLNCGGHAFATNGLLLGPILEEFKNQKPNLITELKQLYDKALNERGIAIPLDQDIAITVQGGIGTAQEQNFLLNYYKVNRTGWGTPFLLVPEATNVDDVTLNMLSKAEKEDLYLSEISPLGVPMNTMKETTAQLEKETRDRKGEPGSPCIKKHLVFNTEFTDKPICTASSEYQKLKIEELKSQTLSQQAYDQEYQSIIEKECLCMGLANTALNNYGIVKKTKAVSICPGPNLAYFSKIMSLEEMVGHIYGKNNVLNNAYRPHMFINELELYYNYFDKQVKLLELYPDEKSVKNLTSFKINILQGIDYYLNLLPEMIKDGLDFDLNKEALLFYKSKIESLNLSFTDNVALD
jgi:hypothetical protein